MCHMPETAIATLPDPPRFSPDPLTGLIRQGARKLIEQAPEARLATLPAAFAGDWSEDGRARLVRDRKAGAEEGRVQGGDHRDGCRRLGDLRRHGGAPRRPEAREQLRAGEPVCIADGGGELHIQAGGGGPVPSAGAGSGHPGRRGHRLGRGRGAASRPDASAVGRHRSGGGDLGPHGQHLLGKYSGQIRHVAWIRFSWEPVRPACGRNGFRHGLRSQLPPPVFPRSAGNACRPEILNQMRPPCRANQLTAAGSPFRDTPIPRPR